MSQEIAQQDAQSRSSLRQSQTSRSSGQASRQSGSANGSGGSAGSASQSSGRKTNSASTDKPAEEALGSQQLLEQQNLLGTDTFLTMRTKFEPRQSTASRESGRDFDPLRPFTAAENTTAVQSAETGGGYQFGRRFMFSGVKSRPNTQGYDASPTKINTLDSNTIGMVTEALGDLDENLATDPLAAPSFGVLDLAELIDIVLEKLRITPRSADGDFVTEMPQRAESAFFGSMALRNDSPLRTDSMLIRMTSSNDQLTSMPKLTHPLKGSVAFANDQLSSMPRLTEPLKGSVELSPRLERVASKGSLDVLNEPKEAPVAKIQPQTKEPPVRNNEASTSPDLEVPLPSPDAATQPQTSTIAEEVTAPLAQSPLPIPVDPLLTAALEKELRDEIKQLTSKANLREIKVKVQAQVITALGRKVDKFSKHNAALIHQNKLLIHERDIATQTRADLYLILQETNEKNAQDTTALPQVVKKDLRPRTVAGEPLPEVAFEYQEREFFEEEEILDSAYEQLGHLVSQHKLAEDQETGHFGWGMDTPATETIEDDDFTFSSESAMQSEFARHLDKEMMEYSARMISMKKRYDPPSTLGIGLKWSSDSYDLKKKNPYLDVKKGRPTNYQASIYHPRKLKHLAIQASNHIESIHSTVLKQTHQLLQATSPQQYIEHLHNYLGESKALLHECLDALAEEQRNARRWRGQCAEVVQRIENIRSLYDKERSLQKKVLMKRNMVVVNALAPIVHPVKSRPSSMAHPHPESPFTQRGPSEIPQTSYVEQVDPYYSPVDGDQEESEHENEQVNEEQESVNDVPENIIYSPLPLDTPYPYEKEDESHPHRLPPLPSTRIIHTGSNPIENEKTQIYIPALTSNAFGTMRVLGQDRSPPTYQSARAKLEKYQLI